MAAERGELWSNNLILIGNDVSELGTNVMSTMQSKHDSNNMQRRTMMSTVKQVQEIKKQKKKR